MPKLSSETKSDLFLNVFLEQQVFFCRCQQKDLTRNPLVNSSALHTMSVNNAMRDKSESFLCLDFSTMLNGCHQHCYFLIQRSDTGSVFHITLPLYNQSFAMDRHKIIPHSHQYRVPPRDCVESAQACPVCLYPGARLTYLVVHSCTTRSTRTSGGRWVHYTHVRGRYVLYAHVRGQISALRKRQGQVCAIRARQGASVCSTRMSGAGVCSTHTSGSGVCSTHMSGAGVCSTRTSGAGVCSTHTSVAGVCSTRTSGGWCVLYMTSGSSCVIYTHVRGEMCAPPKTSGQEAFAPLAKRLVRRQVCRPDTFHVHCKINRINSIWKPKIWTLLDPILYNKLQSMIYTQLLVFDPYYLLLPDCIIFESRLLTILWKIAHLLLRRFAIITSCMQLKCFDLNHRNVVCVLIITHFFKYTEHKHRLTTLPLFISDLLPLRQCSEMLCPLVKLTLAGENWRRCRRVYHFR